MTVGSCDPTDAVGWSTGRIGRGRSPFTRPMRECVAARPGPV